MFQIREGGARVEIIRMQLKDAPLIVGGALGASISGMTAPGISALLSRILEVNKLKTRGISTLLSQT